MQLIDQGAGTAQARKNSTFQFTMRGLLWAMLWIGVALATLPWFDATHFLDDDGDNVGPRMLAALWVAMAVGAIGSLRGRPIAWGAGALLAWIPVCAVIILLAILPGLL